MLAALLVVASAAAAAEDWPQFRGPNGAGISESTGAPVEFGPGKNLKWKTDVPFGRSSPVTSGGRIFVSAHQDGRLITLAIDITNGRVLWRKELIRARVTPVYMHNDAASSTPVTDGESVYAFFPDYGLVAYTKMGVEKWKLPLGPFDTFYGLASSPILAGDVVLLSCEARTGAFLIAVDKNTGRVRWRTERAHVRMESYATPVLSKGEALLLGWGGLESYSVSTGDRLWSMRGLGSMPVALPVLFEDKVIVSTFGGENMKLPTFDEMLKKSDKDADGRISKSEIDNTLASEFGAFDRNGDGFIDRAEYDVLAGENFDGYGFAGIRLSNRVVEWREKKMFTSIPSPLVYQGVLYMVKGGGILSTLDPATGRILKTARSDKAKEDHWASPVGVDGKVYFTSEQGKVSVLKAAAQWEILAVNDLGAQTFATPAVSGGNLIFRTRESLLCFGK